MIPSKRKLSCVPVRDRPVALLVTLRPLAALAYAPRLSLESRPSRNNLDIFAMARTKEPARRSTAGKAPITPPVDEQDIPTDVDEDDDQENDVSASDR